MLDFMFIGFIGSIGTFIAGLSAIMLGDYFKNELVEMIGFLCTYPAAVLTFIFFVLLLFT
jgi:hypothetical protein